MTIIIQGHKVTVDAVALTLLLDLAKDRKFLLSPLQLKALEEPLRTLWADLVTDLLGAIVKPVSGTNYLRSGDAAYGEAVVISKEPFILAAPDGKTQWREQDPDKFFIVGKAPEELLAKLQQQWLIK